MPTVTVDSTTQRYRSYVVQEPDILLLHTTEGMGWPGYNGGGTAPHDTIKPIRGQGIIVRRHYPYEEFSKSLENDAGGVETNKRGVIQVELMGTCDPQHRYDSDWYFWPDADDAVLEALADYYRPIMAEYGIPARAMAEFVAYPASYGNTPTRLTYAEWMNGSGICGHQHAPENAHGDPGKFPIARFIAFLEGEDMPTVDEIWNEPIKRGEGQTDVPARNALSAAMMDSYRAREAARGAVADVAALSVLVGQLLAAHPGQPLTADEIVAAAKAGAAAALDEKIVDADVVLKVGE